MNVLLTAGPESTTLFTILVQESGRSPARLAGRRHVTVPLNRLQSTYRRLHLAGDTILSITRWGPVGDPPPSHPMASPAGETARSPLREQPPIIHQKQTAAASVVTSVGNVVPEGRSVSEAPGISQPPAPLVPPAGETARPPLREQPPKQFHPEAGNTSVRDDVIVLLLSLCGGVILLTLRMAQSLARLAQQQATRFQGQRCPHPPVGGVQERRDWPTVEAATRTS